MKTFRAEILTIFSLLFWSKQWHQKDISKLTYLYTHLPLWYEVRYLNLLEHSMRLVTWSIRFKISSMNLLTYLETRALILWFLLTSMYIVLSAMAVFFNLMEKIKGISCSGINSSHTVQEISWQPFCNLTLKRGP